MYEGHPFVYFFRVKHTAMTRKLAVVTGASAGIGEKLAGLFAKDGVEVVLVARSEGKLKALGEKLGHLHNTTCHVVAADLADPKAPQAIFERVQKLGAPVEFLVNNAGFGSNGPFLEQTLSGQTDMLQVNCVSLLALSHLFGQAMKKQGRGRILNIASTAAFLSGPYMATYYASKAFVVSFSEALAHELKGTGVTVTCHCPAATHTEFGQRADMGSTNMFKYLQVATADAVAADAYEAMMEGDVVAVHGAVNWVGTVLSRVMPRAVSRQIAGLLNQRQGPSA
jgi:uncharacterized protein